MAQKKQFYILTEDLDAIEQVSPSIKRIFDSLFVVRPIKYKSANIDYFECRLRFRDFDHVNKRRYLSLVHSCHAVACDLYRQDCSMEYMAFDCLFTHLINML